MTIFVMRQLWALPIRNGNLGNRPRADIPRFDDPRGVFVRVRPGLMIDNGDQPALMLRQRARHMHRLVDRMRRRHRKRLRRTPAQIPA
jgi:hypothetical protein